MLRPALVLLSALLIGGCTQWRYDMGEPIAALDNNSSQGGLAATIPNMSLAQVLDLLGPPHHVSAADTGFAMAWEHWHIREDSIGVSLGAMGADFLTFDWGRMHAKGEFVLLTFNDEHQLTAMSRSQWDGPAGGGMAVQPFVSVVSVVDSDDLRDPLPQHNWGAGLLQQLPRGLNRASNSDEGRNGLQQRGTPAAVGQHTLDTTR